MVVFLQNLTIYRENTRNKNCFIFTVNDQLLNYVTIILSNNFLLAVTTDSHSENSHNSQLYLSLPWKQEHCIGGSWRFYCTAFHRSFTSVCDGGLHNKGAAHLFLFSLTFFLMPMLRKCALGYFPDSLWLWEMAAGGRWDKQHPSSWGELWLAVNSGRPWLAVEVNLSGDGLVVVLLVAGLVVVLEVVLPVTLVPIRPCHLKQKV